MVILDGFRSMQRRLIELAAMDLDEPADLDEVEKIHSVALSMLALFSAGMTRSHSLN